MAVPVRILWGTKDSDGLLGRGARGAARGSLPRAIVETEQRFAALFSVGKAGRRARCPNRQ